MGTLVLECGCSLSTDMFNYEVLDYHLCPKHLKRSIKNNWTFKDIYSKVFHNDPLKPKPDESRKND